MPGPKGHVAKRLLLCTDRSGGPLSCWPYTGKSLAVGYGRIWDDREGRNRGTHRVAWELANGERVPDERVVCHACDNRLCCNPAHLFVGTQADNVRDAQAKGLIRSGSKHPGARLDESAVREIRGLAAAGLKHGVIASRFGMARVTIQAIVARRLWRHLPSGG